MRGINQKEGCFNPVLRLSSAFALMLAGLGYKPQPRELHPYFRIVHPQQCGMVAPSVKVCNYDSPITSYSHHMTAVASIQIADGSWVDTAAIDMPPQELRNFEVALNGLFLITDEDLRLVVIAHEPFLSKFNRPPFNLPAGDEQRPITTAS